MAADSRGSRQLGAGMHSYADVSEKLFTAEYVDSLGQTVQLGICTSGTASVPISDSKGKNIANITIAEILSSFLRAVRKKRRTINSAEMAITDLLRYISNAYPHHNVVTQCAPFLSFQSLGLYIQQTTCFGISLYYGDQSSIAGYNTRGSILGLDYLEASFGATCIAHRFPTYSNPKAVLTFLSQQDNPDQASYDFVKAIIATARATIPNAAQTIGGYTDVAILSAENPIYLELGKKANVATASHQQPYMFGSDRVLTDLPAPQQQAIAFDPSRDIVSAREERQTYPLDRTDPMPSLDKQRATLFDPSRQQVSDRGGAAARHSRLDQALGSGRRPAPGRRFDE